MASAVGRVAQQAGKAAGNAAKASKGGEDTVLKKGARRDPELYVCQQHRERVLEYMLT